MNDKPNTITIEVTRDSVCMGDDVLSPHLLSFMAGESSTIRQVIEEIIDSGYFKDVTNFDWELSGSKPLAIVYPSFGETKYHVPEDTPISEYDVKDGLLRFKLKHLDQEPFPSIKIIQKIWSWFDR